MIYYNNFYCYLVFRTVFRVNLRYELRRYLTSDLIQHRHVCTCIYHFSLTLDVKHTRPSDTCTHIYNTYSTNIMMYNNV